MYFVFSFVFENGSKQIFSSLLEKVLIQGVCLRTQAVSIKSRVIVLKGGLLVFRKSQKISTDSDLNFLYYVKKTTAIPPPRRNRVKHTWIEKISMHAIIIIIS